MVVVFRQHGLRFTIFVDDHEPAHVHVYGDGELKVNIFGPDGLPEMVFSRGFKLNDERRAMDVVRDRQDEFLAGWKRIHEAE